MKIEDIKKEAAKQKYETAEQLSVKVAALKNNGLSFLGCVAFVQANQNISLQKAKELTMELDAYNEEEKERIEGFYRLMLSEFEEE